jgi:phage gpG-like protein
MITAQIVGDDKLIGKLRSLPGRMRPRLKQTVKVLTIKLQRYVKEKKLTGQVLHVRTDNLRGSINQHVEETATGAVGIVGTNVKYARILEFGGVTKPHDIVPVKKQALAFMGRDGSLVIRKLVHHPGSKIKEYRFLRGALADMKPEILARLSADISTFVREELRP